MRNRMAGSVAGGAAAVIWLGHDILLHASTHGGQESCSNGGGEGQLGDWGVAGIDGVAFVCAATIAFNFVCEAQQGSVRGLVATTVVSHSNAALGTEA